MSTHTSLAGRGDAARPAGPPAVRAARSRRRPGLVVSRRTRIGIVAVLALVGLGLAAPAAGAGTFVLRQCSAGAAVSDAAWSASTPLLLQTCHAGGGSISVDADAHRLQHNRQVALTFAVPGGMPTTTIASFTASYQSQPQIGSVNPAYFQIWSGAAKLRDVPVGTAGWGEYHRSPSGARTVQFLTFCSVANGPGYCNWGSQLLNVYGLELTLAESGAPSASGSGAVLGTGPQQGVRALRVVVRDADSGVRTVTATLGGTPVGALTSACANDVLPPCPQTVDRVLDIDTALVPDGTRLLRLVATDYAGNSSTTDLGYVTVDNVPAPVSTSAPIVTGVARHGESLMADDGAWIGRGLTFARRWQRLEAGVWTDIAGATSATYRVKPADYGKPLRFWVRASNADGTTDAYSEPTDPIAAPDAPPPPPVPTVAPPPPPPPPAIASPALPLPAPVAAPATLLAAFEGTDRQSVRVKWGERPTITGTLRSGDGQPVVGARIEITATPHLRGGTPPSTPAAATTDAEGRFTYRVPAGVSRTLRLRAGSAQAADLVVHVAPKVALTANRALLRTGQTATLRGTVTGAPGGVRKLVELQVRVGGRWWTFASTRLSREDGTFSGRYRLPGARTSREHRFRALVRAEEGWPFLAGRSSAVKVRVRPKI